MNFLEKSKQWKGNIGTSILIIASSILTLAVSQLFSELIANKFFGFSLLSPPQNEGKNIVFSLMLLPFLWLLLLFLWWASRLHHVSWTSWINAYNKFRKNRFFFVFFIWFGILFIGLFIELLFDSPLTFQFNLKNFLVLCVISFILLPIQTLTEELLFRSYLPKTIFRFTNNVTLSTVISGVLFGLMHAANPEIQKIGNIALIYYILTGIFLSLITVKDNGIELAYGFHFANNLFGALIVTNNWQVFQTDALFIDHSPPEFGFSMIITLLILYPFLYFIFQRKFFNQSTNSF